MVEFFQSIFNWFVTNKDEIVLFFTSANFMTFITTIILIIKQIRASKSGNKAVKNLSDNLTETTKLSDNIRSAANSSTETLNTAKDIESKVEEFNKDVANSVDTMLSKLNAILDVQSIIYAGVKDETVRKNINNILTTAKLSETKTRAELETKIKELEELVKNKVTEVKEAVDETATAVKKVVSTKKSNVQRY